MGASRFEELDCWQLANELKSAVYTLIDRREIVEDRDFRDDFRSAARSAPSNIAEGFGRHTPREFAHFVSIAKASLVETENHLLHARDIGGVSADECSHLVALAQRAQKATSGLWRYLLSPRNKRHPPDRRRR